MAGGKYTFTAKIGDKAYKTVTLTNKTSEERPLSIDNVEDLVAFRNAVNSRSEYKGITLTDGGIDMYFKLTADLNLATVCGKSVNGKEESWTPIGIDDENNKEKPFKGHFDGGGHTISNLYINFESGRQALFGYIHTATIKNLNLVGTDVTGGYRVGGVCATTWEGSTIEHCTNSGSVSGNGYVGGVCGFAEEKSKIEYCANAGSVSGSGSVGGVCGVAKDSEIKYCLNTGSVSGTGNVGAVCGYNYKGTSTITSCYYDKQMCPVANGIGATNEDGTEGNSDNAEGKLTSEMVGNKLQTVLGDNWKFNADMYPIPAGLKDNEAAIAASTPVFLFVNDADNTKYETANAITSDFKVGTGTGNNITWEASNTAVSVSGANVSLVAGGSYTLTAKIGDKAYKTVTLTNAENYALTIDNEQDLQDFRNEINTGAAFTYKSVNVPAGGKGKHFKLTADLDLATVCGANVGVSGTSWTPIGNSLNKFQGHFDGNNHTISNLYINAPENSDQALFGYISGAEIKNLSLAGVNVTGLYDVGGVCGSVKEVSTISNCLNNGSVNGKDNVGGVCGSASNSTISKCLNSGSVTGNSFVGGVCGATPSSTISYCLNTGSVTGSSNVYGVCHYDFSSTITSCYYDKQICTANEDMDKGKLISELTSGKLFNNAEIWSEAKGRYPIPAGLESNDAAIVAATPIFLVNEETADAVATDFTVGTIDGATWTATTTAGEISFDKEEATITKNGEVTLTLTKGDVSKSVTLTFKKLPTIAEIPVPEAVKYGNKLALTPPTITDYGTDLTSQGWEIETATAGTFTRLVIPYVVKFADNGKKLRYEATNDYGTTYSNEVTITVSQRTLTATLSIKTSKVYDGTTEAAATATLGNAIVGDDVTLAVASATYDNKNVGSDKTITVTYSIGGNDAGYYIAPATYATTGAITALQLTATPSVTTSKDYDGTDAAAATASLDNAIAGDDVTLAVVSATYDNKSVGSDKAITVAYSIGGNDAGNYIAPATGATTGAITALQLTATPSVTATKEYDGNSLAAATATLDNAVAGDDVTVSVISATYDNASVDINKTITVTYAISGADAGNYIAPAASTATGAIVGHVTFAPLAAPAPVCSGEAISPAAPAVVEDCGMDCTYRWEISGDGFATATEYTGQALTEKHDGWKIRYTAESTTGAWHSGEAALTVNLDPSYIARLWDDVLALYNTKEITFASWQWYRNGSAIPSGPGEGIFSSRAYIRMSGNASEYQVAAATADGHTYFSCPIKGSAKSQPVSLKAYPNPSPASQPLTVEAVGLDEGMLEGATLVAYSTTGVQVLSMSSVSKTTEIRLPQGIYVVALRIGDRTISTKVIRR